MAGITKKKTSRGGFALYIILFVGLIALSGVLNFIIAEFSLAVILTASYWVKTITSALIGLGSFVLSSFMRRDAKLYKDEVFNASIDELNDTINNQVGDDFSEYIAHMNRLEKIKAHRTKQENKLTKWNNRVRAKTLIAIKLIEDGKWEALTEAIKPHRLFKRLFTYRRYRKATKWSRKRAKIKLKLTNEWIEDNIDYTKVKYSDITRSEILTGERSNINGRIIDNSALRHIAKDRLPVIMTTTLLMAVYHSLNFVEAINPIGLILGALIQLVMIGTNAVLGFNYGETLFRKVDQNNLFIRKEYVMGYLKWRKN